ncbi:MAG: hypothetical protein WC655_13690, partial [Candidatus Hydrogenedentales bacterium]
MMSALRWVALGSAIVSLGFYASLALSRGEWLPFLQSLVGNAMVIVDIPSIAGLVCLVVVVILGSPKDRRKTDLLIAGMLIPVATVSVFLYVLHRLRVIADPGFGAAPIVAAEVVCMILFLFATYLGFLLSKRWAAWTAAAGILSLSIILLHPVGLEPTEDDLPVGESSTVEIVDSSGDLTIVT